MPYHTTKKRGIRFRHFMKHTILPEASLPSMTKIYARTTKEIAEALGYKTHSAVTKRLQAMREQFEKHMKEQC